MNSNKIILIFDFDGTITRRDTLIDFIIFNFGLTKFLLGILKCLPYLFLFKIKIVSNQNAKEHLLRHFLFNTLIEDLIESGYEYSKKKLPKILNSKAMAILDFHRRQGDELVIVSASPKYWYQDWAYKNGITKIISTELEILDNKITGNISGNNCYGIEKVNMLKSKIDLSSYTHIIMYGDSKGDYDLINIANEGYIKFKKVK